MAKRLEIEVTHKFEGTTMSELEFQRMLDIVSWKQIPMFPHRGRMAWATFDEKMEMRNGHKRSLLGAKIKGVGGFNPESDARNRDPIYHKTTSKPFQPTSDPLLSFASYPHLGFDANGEFRFVYGAVSPIGGILYDRAVTEYQCALHLLKHDVPAIVPLTVIKYNDLQFEGRQMGAVICLSPSEVPYRLSEVQFGASLRRGDSMGKDQFYLNILQSLDITTDPVAEQTRLNALTQLAAKIGKLIHDFSYSGLYRYSVELPNFEYDSKSRQVILTDLDSSRLLCSLPPSLQRLEVLRDMASMLYHFIAKFASPLALGHYTLGNLLKYDPILDLIMGYFPLAKEEKVSAISKRLWNCFIPHFMLLNKHKEQILNEWSTERRRSYKMDHDLFFIVAIISLYPIFCESKLGHQYPDPMLTSTELEMRAERFLKERFTYFEYLMTVNH